MATGSFIADVRASGEVGVAAARRPKAVGKHPVATPKPSQEQHWLTFNRCVPFDGTRGSDEVRQRPDLRIRAAQRARQRWATLDRG